MPFFENLQGSDEEVTEEFSVSLIPHSKTHASVSFRGLTMEIALEFISKVISLSLGLPWSKEEKPLGQVSKKTFFQADEHPIEEKNGIRRKSIPYPGDEVNYQIIKYISPRIYENARWVWTKPTSLSAKLDENPIFCSARLLTIPPIERAPIGLVTTPLVPDKWRSYKNDKEKWFWGSRGGRELTVVEGTMIKMETKVVNKLERAYLFLRARFSATRWGGEKGTLPLFRILVPIAVSSWDFMLSTHNHLPSLELKFKTATTTWLLDFSMSWLDTRAMWS